MLEKYKPEERISELLLMRASANIVLLHRHYHGDVRGQLDEWLPSETTRMPDNSSGKFSLLINSLNSPRTKP